MRNGLLVTVIFIVGLSIPQVCGYRSLPTAKDLANFITTDSSVAILYCHENDSHCNSILQLIRSFGDWPVHQKIKLGFFSSQSDFTSIAEISGSSGNNFIFYHKGNLHNKISIEDIQNQNDLRIFFERSLKNLLPEVISLSQFEDEVHSCNTGVSTVAYFSSDEDIEIERVLVSLYLQYGDIIQFRVLRDPAMIVRAGGSDKMIKIYQCFENTIPRQFSRPVDGDLKELENWILRKGLPLVGEFSHKTVKRTLELFEVCVIVGIPEDQSEGVLQSVTAIADEFKSVGFVWSTAESLKEYFIDSGATGKVFPTAMAITSLTESPIVWDEKNEFSVENLRRWVSEVKEGTAEVFKKSGPIPPPSKNIVKTLVHDNFLSTVSVPSKKSVVLIYGRYSRCRECYSAKVEFSKVAESLHKKYSVDFYEYNLEENYLSVPITRLPEIFFYNGGHIERFPDQAVSEINILKWLLSFLPKRHDEL